FTPFFFSSGCQSSFEILKKKLTEAPILLSSDWDLPFELMCDASDFAVGAVLGQRKEKYFRPIHYASMTLSDAQTHYTTTKKELLAVVYAFEKFHSLAPGICDKKGAENLAADHLSRLENPHQGGRVGMQINDNFPHETLNMISLNLDNEPPWFADIANYLVGNVLVRGIRAGLWIFFRLATMVPPGDIKARTTPPRKFLTMVFSGPPYIAMPMTLSHTVTHVNVKEKSHRGTKCPKILFRFVRSLTSEASTLWAHSRLHEGTDIYSWLSTICLNGLKRKRSPLMTPELL
ncbi:reverse transcriptase domain-containing protein, partial [Tanacetum coccineum]